MNQLVAVNAPPPMNVSEIERVALAIAKGGLFGSKDPNAVLTLCFLAYAEGQHPAVVFRDYHIIQGKPAKKADAMLRDFINAGGKVKWHTLDDKCADATFTHPAGEARIEWTMERAKKAKITNPMWDKYPRQMLRSRVISEGVRTVYPGATSGLYEENEIRDIVAEEKPAFIEQREPEQQAAHEELQQQLEQSVEQAAEPAKRKPAHSKLKTELRGFVHELNGCGDGDELSAFLATPDAIRIVNETREKLPHLWDGDNWPEGVERPEEFVPLADLITKRQRECAQASADYLTA